MCCRRGAQALHAAGAGGRSMQAWDEEEEEEGVGKGGGKQGGHRGGSLGGSSADEGGDNAAGGGSAHARARRIINSGSEREARDGVAKGSEGEKEFVGMQRGRSAAAAACEEGNAGGAGRQAAQQVHAMDAEALMQRRGACIRRLCANLLESCTASVTWSKEQTCL